MRHSQTWCVSGETADHFRLPKLTKQLLPRLSANDYTVKLPYCTCIFISGPLHAPTTLCSLIDCRIYLEYHTISQVLCGAVIGSVVGGVWFVVVHKLMSPYFPIIAAW